MSKEDVGAVFAILSICLNLGFLIDLRFFARDRWINELLARAKKSKRCMICQRPMLIVPEEE